MKIWVDDIRPAPHGYFHCYSVNQAIELIRLSRFFWDKFPNLSDIEPIKVIDLDHDAGDYQYDGGDYINLLNWLEASNLDFPIAIHTMNPVGAENMRRIIRRNGWKEVKGGYL